MVFFFSLHALLFLPCGDCLDGIDLSPGNFLPLKRLAHSPLSHESPLHDHLVYDCRQGPLLPSELSHEPVSDAAHDLREALPGSPADIENLLAVGPHHEVGGEVLLVLITPPSEAGSERRQLTFHGVRVNHT